MLSRLTIPASLLLYVGLLTALPIQAGEPVDGDVPWSFAPIRRPAVPKTAHSDWALDELDHFILARIESEELRPNSGADRRTLIRRAAFDLTGLPPTRDEIARFLRNPASDETAFADVVDEYLASERFGERWGRHWLDVARYADSIGRSVNAPFVYAWRYRNWVIDSLNDDKPYDRFITEQIAGDLLPATTVEQRREQITATGLLALGSLNVTINIKPFTLDQIDDQIDVVGRGFLGLSIACARCHDHKYDPVSQVDYYALAGIFNSSRTWSGVPVRSERAGYGYVSPVTLLRLPRNAGEPVGRVQNVPAGLHSGTDARRFSTAKAPPFDIMPDCAMGMSEGPPANCAVREGGHVRSLGVTPPRGEGFEIPRLPGFSEVPESASGRLQLAQWITSPRHPLTARVMVNRIWQHLFGRGLVDTVDNFGMTGSEPSHPKLLDHLAIRFVNDGWSVKRMIRAIMLSRTWQLSGEPRADNQAKDPDNQFYWRANARRLELEPLRDTLLFVGGNLRPERPEPGVLAGFGGGNNVGTRAELDFHAPFRTVYLPVVRDMLPGEYGVFDFPDPSTVAGRRHVTTVPTQALFFMNSRFVEGAASKAAARLIAAATSDAARIDLAYETILGRPPEADERISALGLIRRVKGPRANRLAVLVQALFATTEFRYVL